MAIEANWRDAPVAWFEGWTRAPFSVEDVRAAAAFAKSDDGAPCCDAFAREVVSRAAHYPELPWHELGGVALLHSTLIGLMVARHLERGLPEIFDAVVLAERRGILSSALIALEARQLGYENPAAVIDRALVAGGCELALPYLGGEFERRAKCHRGVRAASFLLERHLTAGDERPGIRLSSLALPAVLSPLVRTVATRTRKRRKTKGPDEGEAMSQLAVTIIEKWGHIPPLTVLAQALDGRLNIAARAAGDDILDEDRLCVRQAELVVDFEAIRPPEIPLDDQIVRAVAVEKIRETEEGLKLFGAIEGLRLEQKGSQSEIAAALGNTDRTIRNWVADLNRRFGEEGL